LGGSPKPDRSGYGRTAGIIVAADGPYPIDPGRDCGDYRGVAGAGPKRDEPAESTDIDWLELWSLARVRGIGSAEFWGLTFREFRAILDRFAEIEDRDFLRAGIVAATIANVHRGPNQDPFTPADFMPGGRQPEQMDGEKMLEKIRAVNAALGGTEK